MHQYEADVRSSVQGGAARLRLSFVDKKLGVPPLLPSCYAHSARFLPAQAQLGRLRNIPDIGKLNLGLRRAAPPYIAFRKNTNNRVAIQLQKFPLENPLGKPLGSPIL